MFYIIVCYCELPYLTNPFCALKNKETKLLTPHIYTMTLLGINNGVSNFQH